MGIDYSLWAMLFVIATSLAPSSSRTLTFENEAQPGQTAVWTREGTQWELRLNGRPAGSFRVEGVDVVHTLSPGEQRRYSLHQLVEPVGPQDRQAVLRGPFENRRLRIERGSSGIRLIDRERRVLPASLRLVIGR